MASLATQMAAVINGVNVEYIRQAGIIRKSAEGGNARAQWMEREIQAGNLNMSAAWAEFTGDDRVGLHVKIDKDIRDALKQFSADNDMAMSEAVGAILFLWLRDKYLSGEE